MAATDSAGESWATLPSGVLSSIIEKGRVGNNEERLSFLKSLRSVNKRFCKHVSHSLTFVNPHNLEKEDFMKFLDRMQTTFVNVKRIEFPAVWVDDDCCEDLVRHCPGLNDLEIFWGDCISDDGLKSLAKLPIASLKVYHSRQITDEGLRALTACPALEVLWLYGATEVTDDGLVALGSIDSLRAIRLMYCNRLTRRGLQPLIQKEGLQIFVRYCRRISTEVNIS